VCANRISNGALNPQVHFDRCVVHREEEEEEEGDEGGDTRALTQKARRERGGPLLSLSPPLNSVTNSYIKISRGRKVTPGHLYSTYLFRLFRLLPTGKLFQ